MNSTTFDSLRELIHFHSGISLGQGKEALISSRLAKRIRELGLRDEAEYLDVVNHDASLEELSHLIDMVSTNVTQFLREFDHFEYISDLLRETWTSGARSIRCWCAACSTGQEPYTLAMVMHEVAEKLGIDPRNAAKILATDISTRVLRYAERGSYREKEIEQVPRAWISRYFQQNRDPPDYQVIESIRSLITFRRINLAHTPFPMQGPFDVILCRNVMIYFEDDVRSGIVGEAERLLRPGGLLMIGHAETLSGLNTALVQIRPTVYRKESAA